MSEIRQKHHVDILFIIVLIGLFAVSSVGLALLGVNIYKTTSQSSNDDLNTAALYFAQKVRQCDDRNQVRVANLAGEEPSLVISSVADGKKLETWLYVYDGTLKEVTVPEGSDVDPLFGQDVMDLDAVDFNLVTDKLLQVTLTSSEGDVDTINLSMIGGGGN